MGRFRKKPVEVEAVQFTGDNWAEMHDFTGHTEDVTGQFDVFAEVQPLTLSGLRFAAVLWNQNTASWDRVALGWWVIKNDENEFSTCDEDTFVATYERVEDV
jgi:hypothetical protein